VNVRAILISSTGLAIVTSDETVKSDANIVVVVMMVMMVVMRIAVVV
jgi:hypothetical protein